MGELIKVLAPAQDSSDGACGPGLCVETRSPVSPFHFESVLYEKPGCLLGGPCLQQLFSHSVLTTTALFLAPFYKSERGSGLCEGARREERRNRGDNRIRSLLCPLSSLFVLFCFDTFFEQVINPGAGLEPQWSEGAGKSRELSSRRNPRTHTVTQRLPPPPRLPLQLSLNSDHLSVLCPSVPQSW